MRRPSIWLIFIALLVANYLIVTFLFPGPGRPVEIPYTLFRQQVEAGNVVAISSRSDMLQGTFATPVLFPSPASEAGSGGETGGTGSEADRPEPVDVTIFSTTVPSFVGPGLEQLLLDNDVEINATSIDTPRNPLLSLLLSFGPTLLLVGLFIWMSRRLRAGGLGGGLGGAFGMGQSKAKRYDEAADSDRVTFDDVAGIDEARDELVEIVDFLQNPAKYTRLGGTAPKGVLLVGAPGTGKTLLARAVAGEAGVPFFSMTASEFVEMIVGVGASRVRDLFKQAREAAPSIVFIDELDAIGRARGRSSFGGSVGEQEQALNQILTEMDGFSTREGVIVLSATNRPDVLDPALLRAGRFDRHITVQPPDRLGRAKILEVHTRDVPLAADVDLSAVASITPGLVGADLRNLVNEAALVAARRNQDVVKRADFEEALERMLLGPARNVALTLADRKRTAYHEGGHAILGMLLPEADPVTRVSITPRGQSLGVTYQRPVDDRYNYSDTYLRSRIIGALGGRAAEEIVYGDRTTGAQNDLEQATDMAVRMVTRWGMSDAVGPLALAPRGDDFLGGASSYGLEGKPYSEATARLIDEEVRRIVDESYTRALELLGEHRTELEALASALLELETLDEDGVLEVTGLHPKGRREAVERALEAAHEPEAGASPARETEAAASARETEAGASARETEAGASVRETKAAGSPARETDAAVSPAE